MKTCELSGSMSCEKQSQYYPMKLLQVKAAGQSCIYSAQKVQKVIICINSNDI